MNGIFSKFIAFFKLYRWILLLIIPLALFVGYMLFASSTQPAPVDTIISPTSSQIPQPTQIKQEIEETENEFDEGVENRDNFQKKETRSDGSIVYTFNSENPQRPDLLIITSNKDLIFSRTLNSVDLPIAPISTIKESFGEPERIIQGSKSYGQQAVVFIYASVGLVFIGNPQTDEIYEEQHFSPMSVDAYLQRFGDQN